MNNCSEPVVLKIACDTQFLTAVRYHITLNEWILKILLKCVISQKRVITQISFPPFTRKKGTGLVYLCTWKFYFHRLRNVWEMVKKRRTQWGYSWFTSACLFSVMEWINLFTEIITCINPECVFVARQLQCFVGIHSGSIMEVHPTVEVLFDFDMLYSWTNNMLTGHWNMKSGWMEMRYYTNRSWVTRV